MRSYPSTFNDGGGHLVIQNSSRISGNDFSNISTAPYDDMVKRIRSRNINMNSTIRENLFSVQAMNIANYNGYGAENSIDNMGSNSVYSLGNSRQAAYENVMTMPSAFLQQLKTYNLRYKIKTNSLVDVGKVNYDGKAEVLEAQIASIDTVPSMFNPMYNIQYLGICGNVPLLNDTISSMRKNDSDITNCSIRELIRLSQSSNSVLGQARYRYADFMYCKDLGKVSNNHLITLRKFSHPVGDNIFELASPKYSANKKSKTFDTEGSVGVLITWFGTDDNKLEDILTYSYQATWKPLESTIEDVESREDDEEHRGILGFLANSVNPNYASMVERGYALDNSIYNWLGAKLGQKTLRKTDNTEMLRNYDKNKVYSPLNTVQNTHIYEGKLVMNQEITLNFCYKLRAYDNINPKTAMLDLIGNILEVTYRRGKFWGGERRFVGAPQNKAAWQKTTAFIDNAWDKLGGIMSALLSGVNIGNVLSKLAGAISEGASAIVNAAGNAAQQLINGDGDKLAKELGQKIQELNKRIGFSKGLKGLLKNALGRPAMYAMNSLLDGSDVGLWHLTIGNPKNPIAVMGNLILTDATIQHSGPLGIDDFPTDLKVTVKLKPARSRDATEISRMYTRGESAIYISNNNHKLSDYYPVNKGFDEDFYAAQKENQEIQKRNDKKVAEAYQNQANAAAAATERQQKQSETTNDGSANVDSKEAEKQGIENLNKAKEKVAPVQLEAVEKVDELQWKQQELAGNDAEIVSDPWIRNETQAKFNLTRGYSWVHFRLASDENE